jgi:hypothetical protein
MKCIFGIAVALLSLPASAQSADSFCAAVSRDLSALGPALRPLCVPSNAKETAILMAQTPVFDHPSNRQAFLLVSCAAAGKEANAKRSGKVKELWLGDATTARTNQVHVLNVAACAKVQGAIHSGQLKPREALQRIEDATEVRPLPSGTRK